MERVKHLIDLLMNGTYDGDIKTHVLFDVQFENVADSEREVSLSEVSVSWFRFHLRTHTK